MKTKKWTLEICQKEASKYLTLKDFREKSRSCYFTCVDNKWLEEVTKNLIRACKTRNYWNFETCREDALNYNSRNEFKKGSNMAYTKAWKNNWLEDICSHMISIQLPKGYWTKDKCLNEALKFNTRTEFARNRQSAYFQAIQHGWLDEICSHMQINGSLYKRFIYAYEFPDNHVYVGLTCNIENRQQRHLVSGSVFDYCIESSLTPIFKLLTSEPVDPEEASKLENDYLEDYIEAGWIKLNRQKPGGLGGFESKWDYEACKKEALKYYRRTDFKDNCHPAYRASLKYGWAEELFSHMAPPNTVLPDDVITIV